MASLTELARGSSALDEPRIAHLQRLVASWGLLADFCFADLLLFAPIDRDASRFVVLSQVRPTTSQTVYRGDWVGSEVDEDERPLVARSFRLGEIIEGEVTLSALKERVRVLCIPIRLDGEVIGVLTRESAPAFGRQPGELERVYVDVFNRFARMISAGDFPFAEEDTNEQAPRVGDGVVLIDNSGRVEYTSPNAVSALHRVGVHANAEGLRLTELGLDETAVRTAFATLGPVTQEIERGPDVTVLVRCIPLLDGATPTGAVVLLRDISELRRRDRLLVSKDATIREIHHRVKNNLQTISSLLRLQGRRLESAEAKAAIDESARRIRSIALVHETLSREAGDDVAFIDIVRPLTHTFDGNILGPDRPVRFVVQGDAGVLPAIVATPLAVVVNELLQNAVDHAYPLELDLGTEGASVVVRLENDGKSLTVEVADDGVGPPPGFDLDASDGLGLSIVKALVRTELAGTIELRAGGTSDARPGTVVEIVVPVDAPRSSR